jgi:hypothetical protein
MLRPSSPSITLRLDCTSENTATYGHHILPFLSPHFNYPTPVKFRSFKINLGRVYRVIEMVASTSLLISPISHTHCDVIQADSDAELNLSFHDVAELNVNILRQACNLLCLSHLELLSMHIDSPNQSMDWSEAFQHCTEVTMVRVSGRGMIGLLEALTPPKCVNTTARGEGGKRQRDDNCRGAQAQMCDEDDHGLEPVHVHVHVRSSQS